MLGNRAFANLRPVLKALAHIGSPEFIKRISSSKFNYWAGYAANLILVGWLAAQALVWNAGQVESLLSTKQWVICTVGGLGFWTLAEYWLHRTVYHEVESPLRIGHELHHDQPKALMGVPWYITTIVLVGLYYCLAALLDPAKTGVVMAFAWLGYIGYCFVHHSIHHFQFKNPYFRHVLKHHLVHHVHPELNLGITTDIWDHVFGTKRSQ